MEKEERKTHLSKKTILLIGASILLVLGIAATATSITLASYRIGALVTDGTSSNSALNIGNEGTSSQA
ncbi:MAG: hypothetical protein K5694_03345 [Bacilli bacterium]|nr:hypothetical protein [Bacilli bacterium]